jgi:hypothetical protein
MRNKMVIEKKLVKSAYNIIHNIISFMQQWRVLLPKEEQVLVMGAAKRLNMKVGVPVRDENVVWTFHGELPASVGGGNSCLVFAGELVRCVFLSRLRAVSWHEGQCVVTVFVLVSYGAFLKQG